MCLPGDKMRDDYGASDRMLPLGRCLPVPAHFQLGFCLGLLLRAGERATHRKKR
jgi:hypothetical protein